MNLLATSKARKWRMFKVLAHWKCQTQGSHCTWKTWKTWKNRARPGKPGKPGKTGGFGAKTWKNITKPGKKIDFSHKKPKTLNRKSIWKKSNSRKRSQIYLSSFGQRGNYWFLLELQRCSSDMKNSFQAWVLRMKNLKNFNQNWFTGCFPIHN